MPDTGHAEASLRDYWSQRWSTQDSPWTRHGIHALLRDNADAVLAGKREGTVFLPMCGDATELKWFYDQGFRVVGVEFLETVARSFFAANDLTPLEGHSNVNGCKILQTFHQQDTFRCP
ncbi:hypothetical protein HPB49_015017 [Dermacentor silvarum]|uniref:Uncharacterized protein n=1 Tax=Dermacentor silvarum TaxID=543639 RepID=A0ACB8DDE1_DERSI|nr:hypothetical protein HPB49_015017 [Dermacentor silvarum]